MIDYLDLDDVVDIIEQAGLGPLRDLGLLSSGVARPQVTVFGVDAYPDLSTKVAALLHSIARNHALVDGNKRLSWILARTFCRLNDHDLAYSVDDAEDLVLRVARGELEVSDIAASIREHLVRHS